MPVYDELIQEGIGLPIDSGMIGKWYLTKNNYETFSKVRDAITQVKLGTVLESELENLLYDASVLSTDTPAPTEEDIEKAVTNRYRTMRQTIGE